VLTGGQTADVKMALDLVQALKPRKLIADKAYDADWLVYYLQSEGIEVVIPAKKSRLQQRVIDNKAYRQRNIIERTINKLKQYRRIATRYDKTATSFLSLCYIAAIITNLTL
jgi:putative transposase